MAPTLRKTSWILILGSLYALLVFSVVAALWSGRQWSVRTLDNAEAKSQWQAYRRSIAEQAAAGAPVRRQVPRSLEPPALVLLRDHFGSCLVLSLVLASALYGALAFFLSGVLRR